MGLVDLMQHMSMERQPDRLRRRAETTYGLVASRDNNEVSPCQQEADSQGGEAQIPRLPEDIWCHIHSLMPITICCPSCLCHPNLTFSVKTLRSNKKEYENDDIARDFCSKVDQILKRHSGVGVKKLNIQMLGGYNGYVDSWLQIAVRSGIEELSLSMPRRAKYNVPCSLFSNGSGDSIQYLYLTGCSFRPKTELGCLRSLTKLHLYYVSFTGDELGCLLSNSFCLGGLGNQVSQLKMEHVSIFADPSDLRKMQGQQHHKMKTVEIIGFTSAKSLVELTCHIVESVTSLECLTLRTHQSSSRCSESANANKSNKCSPLPVHVLMEAQRALLAIRTYIEPKVPSMVKLSVVETCRRCHAVEL
ncbi:unnamed protein product [Miscanthus lutarioriparius]|uniref:At1g61320/AtMIF1 LRR domain-containing protein n=1 Tax=Miscanthus lutarioriparius TaxID=422564 RepID=A0A811RF27_9POAL|nr:unnamed protein product [Miscanthus lutarioriparius]